MVEDGTAPSFRVRGQDLGFGVQGHGLGFGVLV